MIRFQNIKKKEHLPENINKHFEDMARYKYKSNNLLRGMEYIRKMRIYTGNKPGAILINKRLVKILLFLEANDGVIKEVRAHKFFCGELTEAEKPFYKRLWDDEFTEFQVPESIRNPDVDFEFKKKEKICTENVINAVVKKEKAENEVVNK